MADSLKHKILSGVFWQAFEKIGSQGILFIVSLTLARLLSPKEFGTIAILSVFIALAEVFVDSGFRQALIQKKDLLPIDCDSVFWTNLSLGIVLYAILFYLAPSISRFYAIPVLCPILRVLALIPVIHSCTIVHNALLLKKMLFYLRFRISWSSILLSAIVGIWMAYRGYGVWALAGQQITATVVSTVVTLLLIHWMPHFRFSFSRLKKIFGYSVNLLGVSLIDKLFNDGYRLFIGKLFNVTALGVYNMGEVIPKTAMNAVQSTITSVMFSAFSEIQDSPQRMKQLAQRSIQLCCLLVIPLLVWLAVLAPSLVRAVLGEKWSSSVTFLQIASLQFVFWPLHIINIQIITATGRSRIFLYLEITKKVILILFIFIAYRWGIVAIAWAMAIFSAVGFFINSIPNGKYIQYGSLKQLMDLKEIFITALIAGGGAFVCQKIPCGVWLKIIIQSMAFAIVFGGILFVWHPPVISVCMQLWKKLIGKVRK